MDGLANQLESLFVTQETENSEGGKLTSRSNQEKDTTEEGEPEEEKEVHIDEEGHGQYSTEDKDKILEAVKEGARIMQDELISLLRTEYEKKIKELEEEQQKIDNEK